MGSKESTLKPTLSKSLRPARAASISCVLVAGVVPWSTIFLTHPSYRHIDVTRESRHRTHWHCAVQGGIGGRYILHLVIRFRYMHSNFTDSKIKDWYVLYLCQRHVVDFRRRDAPRESHNLAPQPRLSDQRTPRASRRATCARR